MRTQPLNIDATVLCLNTSGAGAAAGLGDVFVRWVQPEDLVLLVPWALLSDHSTLRLLDLSTREALRSAPGRPEVLGQQLGFVRRAQPEIWNTCYTIHPLWGNQV